MTPKEWASRRSEIRAHLRRSKEVSDGAYRLWDELATGWAWNSNESFPKIDMLASALNKSRATIKRLISQLVDLGLIEKTRNQYSNTYTLVDECPETLLSPRKNRDIAAEVNKRKSPTSENPDGSDVSHLPCSDGSDVSHLSLSDGSDVSHPDGSDVSHLPCSDGSDVSHPDGSDVSHLYKYIKEKISKGREDLQMKDAGGSDDPPLRGTDEPRAKPSRSALGIEPTEPDGDYMSYDENNEIEGLIEDPCPRPRSRKRRAANRDFVPGSGRDLTMGAFPEAIGSSQSLDNLKFDPGATQPVIDSPEALVWALRGEVEEKWGRRASRSFPVELLPKIKGQIRNTILRKYSPEVIRDMVRLVVWDWELAREACFPYRPDQPYPSILAMVQYAEELANRVDTGFATTTARRGSLNTYRDLFIEKKSIMQDEDPY